MGYVRSASRLLAVLLVSLIPAAGIALAQAPSKPKLKTENVILITTDGLRLSEIFQGVDEPMISKIYGNISDTNAIRKWLWRDTPEARREALFPFLWGTVAKQGQIWGNREKGSTVRVSNGHNFSYPGYNEFLTGIPDPAIDSNDKKLNLNTNVFEWLNTLPTTRGKVAATVNWDVLPWILNGPRSRLPIWSGFDVPPGTVRMEVPTALTEMVDSGRTIWNGVLLDTFVGFAARHAVKELKPKALYVSFGETDDWAHDGAYDRYLRSAHEFDRFLSGLWQLCQSLPQYRDKTTFLISVDHGRGPAPIAWKNHGREIADSAYIWFAVMGPDTAPLGERSNTPLVLQAQVAATVAGFLGQDFSSASPRSAKPIPTVIGK
jgi:hypothetical protein